MKGKVPTFSKDCFDFSFILQSGYFAWSWQSFRVAGDLSENKFSNFLQNYNLVQKL